MVDQKKKNPSLQNHFCRTTFLEKWLQIKCSIVSFLYFYFRLKKFFCIFCLVKVDKWMNELKYELPTHFNTPLPLNYLKKIAVFAPSKRFYRWQWASLVIKSLRKKNFFLKPCENHFKVASKCSKLANFTRYFLHLVQSTFNWPY